MNQTSLSENISNDREISIISISPKYNLIDPIWAINWFNLKNKRLYDFYNYLALPHLLFINAKPLFKGRLIRRIEGNDSDEREMLLIVDYPSPGSFLKMVKSKVFQFKGILRILAVKDVTFGFMKRQDDDGKNEITPSKYESSLVYLVHQFQVQQR
jgi:hypothetical protein